MDDLSAGLYGLLPVTVEASGRYVATFDDLGDWVARLGVAAVASGALQGGTLAEDTANNRLANGDMETGDPPSGWHAFSASTLAAVADERPGGSGTAALNIARGSGDLAGYQLIAPIPGARHTMRVWLKNGDATRVGAGPANNFSFAYSYNANTEWVELTNSGTASADNAIFRLYVEGSAGQQGRFDDVSLHPNAVLCTNTAAAATGADGCITARVVIGAAPRELVFRWASMHDFWAVRISGTALQLVKRENGAESTIAAADVDWTTGAVVEVRVALRGYGVAVDVRESGGVWARQITYGAALHNATATLHGVTLYDTGADALTAWQFERQTLLRATAGLFFLGDSKTAGDPWPALLIDALHISDPLQPYREAPERYAVAGYTVAQLRALIAANLASETDTPAHIIVNIGSNDSGTPEASFKADLRACVEALHAKYPNATIYLARPVVLATAPPSTPTAANTSVRGWIDDVITEYPYAKAGIAETDLEGGDSYATNLTDVTHYTTAGQTAAAALWATVLS